MYGQPQSLVRLGSRELGNQFRDWRGESEDPSGGWRGRKFQGERVSDVIAI